MSLARPAPKALDNGVLPRTCIVRSAGRGEGEQREKKMEMAADGSHFPTLGRLGMPTLDWKQRSSSFPTTRQQQHWAGLVPGLLGLLGI